MEAFIVKNIISVTILYKINDKFKKVQRAALRVSQSQVDVSNTDDVILSLTSMRGLETVGITPIFCKYQFEINAFEIYVRITTIPFHISFFFSYHSKI